MVNTNDDRVINPDEMIDHNNANFLQIENVMTIFVAYNQKNIQQGVNWDTWPDWELCLTAMISFKDPSSFDQADTSKQSGRDLSSTTREWYLVAIKLPSKLAKTPLESCLMLEVFPCITLLALTILPPKA